MKIRSIALAALLLASVSLSGASPQANIPSVSGDAASGWEIRTQNALLRLVVDADGVVKTTSLGPLSLASRERALAGPDVPVSNGRVRPLRPQVEVVFPDAVRDVELAFEQGEIRSIEGRLALVITQRDKHYALRVTSYIRPIPELDVVEKWAELENTGKKAIRVVNFQSASCVLPKDDYTLTTLSGDWGREFTAETASLTTGTKTIEVRDFKSYGASYFVVRPQGEENFTAGPVWFGMVLYSGNWRVDFYKKFADVLQITGGVNYWDASWQLEGGTTLAAPRMVFGYTRSGEEGASQRMADYTRTELLRPAKRDELRPVIYNSWYATTFHVNEEHQYELAKVAKEIGVELFMMDDGWFKGRIDDHAGLGDWTVDRNKFPNGLNGLIDKVNELGLDFGIWVEPEMVNPNSDLYRAHPDWIIHFPNRERSVYRYQSVLNLAREDVYQYLLGALSDLLSQHNIKYMKWDQNRHLTQPGWPGESPERQMELRQRYVDNLYRMLDELHERFPDVWFENCSSGGGRVDGGMLRRMDINWTSDNAEAIDRQYIQWGYLSFLPANTMLGLVTDDDHWHGQDIDFAYKCDVTMQGVLGLGPNLSKISPEEKEVLRERVALYKQIRPTVQQGVLYRLLSPFEGERTALQYVARDGREAVLMLYNRAFKGRDLATKNMASPKLPLRGLEADATYTIEGYEGDFSGAYLMEIGLDWPLDRVYTSRIVRITKL